MTYPIAEKFQDGTYIKPIVLKNEFYKGGMLAMERRLRSAMVPFRGAYEEWKGRVDGKPNWEFVGIMWDYVALDLKDEEIK